jgi:hypothetical protein
MDTKTENYGGREKNNQSEKEYGGRRLDRASFGKRFHGHPGFIRWSASESAPGGACVHGQVDAAGISFFLRFCRTDIPLSWSGAALERGLPVSRRGGDTSGHIYSSHFPHIVRFQSGEAFDLKEIIPFNNKIII